MKLGSTASGWFEREGRNAFASGCGRVARHVGGARASGRDKAAPLARGSDTRVAEHAIENNCPRLVDLAERSVGARGWLKPEPIERLRRDLTDDLHRPAPDAAIAEIGDHVAGRGHAAPAR